MGTPPWRGHETGHAEEDSHHAYGSKGVHPGALVMNVHVEQRNGAVILQPDGDVDLASSPTLRTSLQDTQLDSGARIVIDLSNVQYMDSSGVATLVECLQRTRNAGAELHLCHLNERVLSVFQIARLDGVFSIVGTVDDAIAN